MNRLKWQGKAIPILVALLLLFPLGIAAISSLSVAADEAAQYTAAEIEDWLISKVESATITYTSPTVKLHATNSTVIIRDFSLSAGGTDVGLNELRLTVDGSTSVSVVGELALFGKQPRFWCDADIECSASDGIPQITSISGIKFADFTPSFSSTDLNNIKDTINKALDASGLELDSLEGDLTGIDVVAGPKLKLSWSGGSLECSASDLEGKLDGALSTLKTEAEDYLSTGNPSKWSCNVTIVADTMLTLNAQATVFDLTAKIEDMYITFPDCMEASASGAVSLGGKRTTFYGTGCLCCADCIPGLGVNTLGIGDEYTGLRDYIAGSAVNSALRDAMGDLVNNVVDATGLRLCLATFNNIGIVGDNLKIWLEGIPISGVTRGVNCDILDGATLELKLGEYVQDTDVSDGDGNYTLTAPDTGIYTVHASKSGFRPESQTINIAEPETGYELNFCGKTGLIPNAPNVFYVLDCVGNWQYMPVVACCKLGVFRMLDVVGAWQYPVT